MSCTVCPLDICGIASSHPLITCPTPICDQRRGEVFRMRTRPTAMRSTQCYISTGLKVLRVHYVYN